MVYLCSMNPLLILACLYFLMPASPSIGIGEQPHIGLDTKGVIRVVYGNGDKIYCATSHTKGATFESSALVAEVPEMHLGMSRGPQIASSAHYTVITAMDKPGNIHWYRLENLTSEWKDMGAINDIAGSAPEGLMGLTADNEDNFYAVWLDIRTGKHNQIYYSKLAKGSKKWSANLLLYQSPDGHVCECCKPNICAEGKDIAVQFRNWLNGSRDLYLMQSHDGGLSFEKARKLGDGTWKLDGCPMDGGGVAIDAAGKVQTTWQRQGVVYYCRPGEREISMGKGRICSIADNGAAPVISMQTGDTLKIVQPGREGTTIVGRGGFLQSIVLPDHHLLCVWEEDEAILFSRLN